MSPTNEHGQPVGEPLDWEVAPQPVPVELTGRYVTVSGLEHEHTPELYDVDLRQPDDDALWTYRPAERPADRRPRWRRSSPACWRTRPT